MLTQSQAQSEMPFKSTVGIAIIGAGTVGGGVIRLLEQESQKIEHQCGVCLKIRHIVKKNITQLDDIPEQYHAIVTDDWERCIVDSETDVIVEVMGDTVTAEECIRSALQAGKPVVTANKALLADTSNANNDILNYAKKQNVPLMYEAAIAGCIPVVKTLNESLSGDNIQEIYGVVNGTCNYILTLMEEEKCTFSHALANAQHLGYAEANPGLDIDGVDSAHKLLLSVRLAFNTAVSMSDFPISGIRDFEHCDIEFATLNNFRIKLLAIAKRSTTDDTLFEMRVCPTLIPKTHLLASVNGATNAVVIRSIYAGETMFYGEGAGDYPTAVAVVSDIIDICLNRGNLAMTIMGKKSLSTDFTSTFYLRIQVKDQPGVLAQIAHCLAEENISIDTLQQQETTTPDEVNIVLIMHESSQKALLKSIKKIESLDVTTSKAIVLPIERFNKN